MSEQRKVKLGDICNFVKGEIGITKAQAGEYPLVVTGKERKTCDFFQFDTKAVCIPLVSSAGHGKAALNYVHYQEGKFALGSILVAVIPQDENIINAQFLHLYLSRLKDLLLVPLMKGTANVSLSVALIKNIEILLPKIENQIAIVSLFNQIDLDHQELIKENINQKTYLTKLSQAILQEAIEGKLTADWRVKNPVCLGDPNTDVAALLATIKAEKQALIADGKIKKEKPLAPINPDDVPFALPDGWVWCKIDSLVMSLSKDIRTGPFGSSLHKHEHKTQGFPVWGIESISKKGKFTYKNKIFVDNIKAKELTSFSVESGDIIISRSGTVGELCLLPENIQSGFISTNLMKISLNRNIINPAYFSLLFKGTKSIDKQLEKLCFGTTRIFLTQNILSKLLFPLPSIFEQEKIIQRIERLHLLTDELEQQVTERKHHAEQLMQAVLKEAFAG